MPTDGRHEGKQGARFENAGAERVDDRHRLRPQRLDQARRADMGLLVELQRIGIGRIEAAPEHADRPQARNGAHHQLVVDDCDILAFEQHEAEIAGDIGVFVIGFVSRSRRQDGDASLTAALATEQGIAECAEEGREAMDLRFCVDIGKGAGGGDAGFERKAGARWRLRAVGQHPPIAIGAASDLEGQEMQIMAVRRFDADERSQEFRIGRDQGRRQQSFADQTAVAIDVGDDRFQ